MQNILLFHCTDDFLIEPKMTSGKSSQRLGKTNVLQSVRDQPKEIQRLFHWWTFEVLVVWDMLENFLQSTGQFITLWLPREWKKEAQHLWGFNGWIFYF